MLKSVLSFYINLAKLSLSLKDNLRSFIQQAMLILNIKDFGIFYFGYPILLTNQAWQKLKRYDKSVPEQLYSVHLK